MRILDFDFSCLFFCNVTAPLWSVCRGHLIKIFSQYITSYITIQIPKSAVYACDCDASTTYFTRDLHNLSKKRETGVRLGMGGRAHTHDVSQP